MRASFQATLIRYRLPLILLVNLCLTSLGFWLAVWLRYDFDLDKVFTPHLNLALALLLFFRSAAYLYWNLNQGHWRYSSTKDLLNLVIAHVVSSACFAAGIFFIRPNEFPRSVILIEFAFSIILAGGMRLFVRLACERWVEGLDSSTAKDLKDVIVIGAGDSGHLLVKLLLSHKRMGFRSVAVLDDSQRMQGIQVFGVRVTGTISALPDILAQHPQVHTVILAIPSYSSERRRALSDVCLRRGVSLKRVQSFEEMACLDSNARNDDVSIESLLDRELKVEHENEIRMTIAGKRVLVTGGGGSIGSELVRQIMQFGPSSVIVLDNSEYNLFRVEREFAVTYPNIEKHFELASVCDERRLIGIFERFHPELVFHAAAYKHVPLLETNCSEAFSTNIVGTRNVLAVSIGSGVEKFVLISSDKAVEPCSVMGASKRIAESLVQRASATTKGSSRCFAACAVRFGNVINSTGSVVPLFKEQILSGGPLTVTHPDMERFFMSIREAVRLVLSASTLGDQGAVYLLDMGESIKIVDLAIKMLALYGRTDIPIVFTGIRPGERLKEVLTNAHERRSPTRLNKVRRIECGDFMAVDPFAWVESFEKSFAKMESVRIGAEIMEYVEQLQAHSSSAVAA